LAITSIQISAAEMNISTGEVQTPTSAAVKAYTDNYPTG
jgi:hypothetical protein